MLQRWQVAKNARLFPKSSPWWKDRSPTPSKKRAIHSERVEWPSLRIFKSWRLRHSALSRQTPVGITSHVVIRNLYSHALISPLRRSSQSQGGGHEPITFLIRRIVDERPRPVVASLISRPLGIDLTPKYARSGIRWFR